MLWLFIKIILYIVGLTYLTLCFVPFEYAFHGHKYETKKLHGRISWLFHSVGINFDVSGGLKPDFFLHIFKYQIPVFKEKDDGKYIDKKAKNEKEDQPQKKIGIANGWDWFDKDLVGAGLGFVQDILKHMKPKSVHIRGRIGFENPYYTGILSGLVYSIKPLLNSENFHVITVFEDEVAEGEFTIQGRIIIGILCILVLRQVVTKPVRDMIKKMIKSKKEEKSYVI